MKTDIIESNITKRLIEDVMTDKGFASSFGQVAGGTWVWIYHRYWVGRLRLVFGLGHLNRQVAASCLLCEQAAVTHHAVIRFKNPALVLCSAKYGRAGRGQLRMVVEDSTGTEFTECDSTADLLIWLGSQGPQVGHQSTRYPI